MVVRFGTEDFNFTGIDFDKRPLNGIDTVGDCREDGFEALTDGLGFPREIHDQSGAADADGLAGKNGG